MMSLEESNGLNPVWHTKWRDHTVTARREYCREFPISGACSVHGRLSKFRQPSSGEEHVIMPSAVLKQSILDLRNAAAWSRGTCC